MKSNLIQIIKSQSFSDLISDINEIVLDSILDEGFIKEIPLFGLIFKSNNLLITIQEKLFIKKMLTFLKQLESTSTKDRKEQTEKIDNDPTYKTKVGEKLIYIINEADDCEKAKYIGDLYKEFINKKLTYDDFIRSSNCIIKTNIIDLSYFINEPIINNLLEKSHENYLYTGLISQYYYDPIHDTYKTGVITRKKSTILYRESYIGHKIRYFLRKNQNTF